MTLSFDTTSAEKPDPSLYLRKREGSTSGTKPAPKPCASPRAADSPSAPPGSPPAACKPPRSSLFWRMYDRGDLPVRVEQARHNTIRWTADLAAVDLHYYLPVFVDGLLETQEPYRMLARNGVRELVAAAAADRLLPVVPQLILGLRAALRSPADETIMAGLEVMRQLAGHSPQAGAALVPYYRQLLPPLARHLSTNLNIGDRIDYGQRRRAGSLGDVVLAALHALERAGGPAAFPAIKRHVALYQSCVLPPRTTRKP